jgi:dihydroorotase
VHAESASVFDLLDQWRGAPRRYTDFEPRRPRSGAIVAAARVIELVRRHGTETHLVHVSTAEEADLLGAAAYAGLPITYEVTPHHLSFTRDDTERLGARIRLSPAIRTDEDRRRLWEAVLNEEVATVGSDHAPHLLEEKCRPVTDAPPGLPGVQEMLPALFTGMTRIRPAESHDQRLLRVSRLLAANPARLFGLTSKGRLEAGADADLVVFDPDALWSVTAATAASKCGWSAYEGWTFQGRAELTVRRGQVVFRQGADRAYGTADGRWLDGAYSTGTPHGSGTHPAAPAGEPGRTRRTRTRGTSPGRGGRGEHRGQYHGSRRPRLIGAAYLAGI